MLSPKRVRLVKKILPHIIFFLFGGLLYIFIERSTLGDVDHYPETGNSYNFWISVIRVLCQSFILGLIFGVLEEYVFKNLLQKKPFLIKLILKTVLYVAIIFTIANLSNLILNFGKTNLTPTHSDVIDPEVHFTIGFPFLTAMSYTFVLIAISLFYSEMVDYIGLKAITNFFTGKYSKSKMEDRVFMFLDMKSSTTIAEKIGHEQYYQLLNDYYRDMTGAIVATGGEIYQYVGDEIVVSWEYEKGIKDNNCVRCFFLIRDQMEKHAVSYQQKFGVVPGFKAGIHSGQVTTGSVGVIKKEILFTGDVLNTTARIQGLCNEQGVDLLISQTLESTLIMNEKYEVQAKGSFALRGRDQKIELFSVDRL
jgi:adenylate cyclase